MMHGQKNIKLLLLTSQISTETCYIYVQPDDGGRKFTETS